MGRAIARLIATKEGVPDGTPSFVASVPDTCHTRFIAPGHTDYGGKPDKMD